jgi:hypothetical protein
VNGPGRRPWRGRAQPAHVLGYRRQTSLVGGRKEGEIIYTKQGAAPRYREPRCMPAAGVPSRRSAMRSMGGVRSDKSRVAGVASGAGRASSPAHFASNTCDKLSTSIV